MEMAKDLKAQVTEWLKSQNLSPVDPVDFEKLHDILPPDLSVEEVEEVVELVFALQAEGIEAVHSNEPAENDGFNTLAAYVHRIGQIPKISPEEEEILLDGVEQGLQRDIDTLTEAYLPMVLNVAREIGTRREEILDYIQEGSLGLLSAIRSFNGEGSKSFRDYARWHIRKAIHKARLNQEQVLSIPRKITTFFAKFKKVSEALKKKLNRSPMLDEIAAEMNLDLHAVKNDLLLGSALLRKGAEFDEEDTQFMGYIKDIQKTEDFELEDILKFHEFLTKNLEVLTPLEKEILVLHYGLEGTKRMELHEIAEELGLKLQHVDDLEKAALQKISRTLDPVIGGDFSF